MSRGKVKADDIRLALALAICIVCFFICWFPFCISMLLGIYSPDASPSRFHLATLLNFFFTSLLNSLCESDISTWMSSAWTSISFSFFAFFWFSCSNLLWVSEYGYVEEQYFCFCLWPKSPSYAFFMIIVCFGIPLTVMAICNILIYTTVRDNRNENATCKEKNESTIRHKIYHTERKYNTTQNISYSSCLLRINIKCVRCIS
jgi:hypothetical protein